MKVVLTAQRLGEDMRGNVTSFSVQFGSDQNFIVTELEILSGSIKRQNHMNTIKAQQDNKGYCYTRISDSKDVY